MARAVAARGMGALVLLGMAWWPAPALAEAAQESDDIVHAEPAPLADLDWFRVLTEELPEIGEARVGRWPLVLWHGPDARQLDVESVQALARRGIVPSIRLGADYLEAARRIADADAPVIYLQGRGGRWPYDLADPAPDGGIDPGRLEGWRLASESFRGDLLALREAGVTLDAAWLDYENAPVNLRRQDVARDAATVPRVVLADGERFRVYRRQLWQSLVSSYFAAPLREIFPRVAVTNWIVSASRADFPVLDWYNRPHPRTDLGLFTATNPIAYGIDSAFHANLPRAPLRTARQVDRIYTHILLRQVSADAHARRLDAPHMESMVWVGRWVRDHGDFETPVMSRAAYREALRHIWMRGVDGMLVFNTVREGFEQMAVWEVLDAAGVYREMLPDAALLANGEVLNFAVPDAHRRTVFWSGVRSEDQALVRTTNPGDEPVTLRIEAWPGRLLTLEAPPGGATHRLSRKD